MARFFASFSVLRWLLVCIVALCLGVCGGSPTDASCPIVGPTVLFVLPLEFMFDMFCVDWTLLFSGRWFLLMFMGYLT